MGGSPLSWARESGTEVSEDNVNLLLPNKSVTPHTPHMYLLLYLFIYVLECV